MYTTKSPKARTFDVLAIEPIQYLAMMSAIAHEMVRSKARMADERLSGKTKEEEALNHRILADCLGVLRAHEASATSSIAGISH